MASLQEKSEDEMLRRFTDGHHPYVAWRNGEPAAWGWVATRAAEIGELDTTLMVPQNARYLWNFVTLRNHRGRGIYPRLLDAIVRAESPEVEEFWVAYAPENHASGSGIRKAGFHKFADLSYDRWGYPVIRPQSPNGGAAARMLGLVEVEEAVTPCWCCTREKGPGNSPCSSGPCRCDYQQQNVGCL